MFYNKAAYCPVGEHVRLGIILKGEVCSFVCSECKYIFTWNAEGKLLKPVKLQSHKDKKCGCNSCGR